MNSSRKKERGYALPEVLIATVIAAGVLTVAATAVGDIVRLNKATAEHARLLGEAKLITARLHGGMKKQDALDGLDGWRVSYEPYKEKTAGRKPAPFELVTASFGEDAEFTFQILVTARESAP